MQHDPSGPEQHHRPEDLDRVHAEQVEPVVLAEEHLDRRLGDARERRHAGHTFEAGWEQGQGDDEAREERGDAAGLAVSVAWGFRARGPSLLDPGINGRAQQVSNQTGLGTGQVAQILMFLAPIVMAYLGRQKREQGVGAEGLGGLLSGLLGGGQSQSTVLDMASNAFDRDRDGSALDDIASMAFKYMTNR